MQIGLLSSLNGRKELVGEIKGWENVNRKKRSYMQSQVYGGHARTYVLDYLKTQFSEKTVEKMPIISTINLCKRIVDKQASIYTSDPTRSFSNLTDDQQDAIEKWYSENKVNSYFSKANKAFKNQEQTFVMLAPDQSGKLKIRVLKPHNLDAIPSDIDPEIADAYMINAFDKSLANRTTINNENIADSDDYKAQLEKYVTWTKEVNFIFNGKGEVVSEVFSNPIGEIPLIDVSTVKEFEFFVEYCNSIADFNVQFLSGLSDLAQVVKMQGWSVGYLVATENTMPEVLFVGPNMVLKLKVDPNTNHEPNFGYASPNADIEGSMKYLESVLAAFLSSRGLDAATVSTQLSSTKFSSGIERLLAMIEMFEASKEDIDLFKCVENQFFNLFKKWNNVYFGTTQKILDFIIPEESQVEVTYQAPVMAMTQTEKTDNIIKRKEAGLMSRVEAIAEDRGISKEQAEYIAEEIDSEDMTSLKPMQNLDPNVENNSTIDNLDSENSAD